METIDLGRGWRALKHDDGSMTIRNDDIGEGVLLPLDSVRTLKRIIVQAAMHIVDKTLTEAYAEPMSADEAAARAIGWQKEDDRYGKGSGTGLVHPAGRWASNWTAALEVDVAEGWQSRMAGQVGDDMPF